MVVTAEIGPPRGADPDAIRGQAEPLRGWVDAVNVTDNQGGFVRLSSWRRQRAGAGGRASSRSCS